MTPDPKALAEEANAGTTVLTKYGRHLLADGCQRGLDIYAPCICGYDEALRTETAIAIARSAVREHAAIVADALRGLYLHDWVSPEAQRALEFFEGMMK